MYYFRTKEALLVKLLQTVLQENEESRNLAGDLLKKCVDEKILTKDNLAKVCKAILKSYNNRLVLLADVVEYK